MAPMPAPLAPGDGIAKAAGGRFPDGPRRGGHGVCAGSGGGGRGGGLWRPDDGAAPSSLRSVVKTIPLAAGALAAWLAGAPAPLVAGLGLSAAGDLALSRPGERALRAGLAAFFAAHVAYVALFFGLAETPLTGWRLAAAGGAVAYAGAFYWIVQPRLGALSVPVAAYVAVIAAMAGTALFLDAPTAWLGAALFMVSDSVLALELFVWSARRRWSGPIVWATYIAAQTCIAWAALAA